MGKAISGSQDRGGGVDVICCRILCYKFGIIYPNGRMVMINQILRKSDRDSIVPEWRCQSENGCGMPLTRLVLK